MRISEVINEEWSKKYKSSINCSNPKGFSQKAHCAGKKKNEDMSSSGMDSDKNDRAVPELKAALLARKEKLQKYSDSQVYDVINSIMTRIAKAHNISGQELHDMWVDTYDEIPDTWIMGENFADGKNPGRKGLAKRSGVNTKASVSSLRKTAKNSSGEKARMAHWLANMKAGRAKAEDIETDEGWKDWVAGAAMGAAALGASGDAEAAKKKNLDKPAVVQKVKQQAAPQATAPVKKISPAEAEATLKNIAIKSGIKGTELAQFMAQCQHETLNFTKMKEIGGSLDFKKYDPKHAPKKAKVLGNTKVGDGSRYAGRGFIQLTGRDNYKKAGEALGLPLEQHPEMVENPVIAAKVAVWYWKSRVQARVDNFNDTTQVTKYINPGLRGLDNRQSAFKDYKIQLAQR